MGEEGGGGSPASGADTGAGSGELGGGGGASVSGAVGEAVAVGEDGVSGDSACGAEVGAAGVGGSAGPESSCCAAYGAVPVSLGSSSSWSSTWLASTFPRARAFPPANCSSRSASVGTLSFWLHLGHLSFVPARRFGAVRRAPQVHEKMISSGSRLSMEPALSPGVDLERLPVAAILLTGSTEDKTRVRLVKLRLKPPRPPQYRSHKLPACEPTSWQLVATMSRSPQT